MKVPPKHYVMLSFKYVRMRGTAGRFCQCRPMGVSVQLAGDWLMPTVYACEFISLPPFVRDCNQIDVSVIHTDVGSPELCQPSEYVNVSSLIVFRLPMIGIGVMSRKIESGDGRGREQQRDIVGRERERVKGDLKRTSEGGGVGGARERERKGGRGEGGRKG